MAQFLYYDQQECPQASRNTGKTHDMTGPDRTKPRYSDVNTVDKKSRSGYGRPHDFRKDRPYGNTVDNSGNTVDTEEFRNARAPFVTHAPEHPPGWTDRRIREHRLGAEQNMHSGPEMIRQRLTSLKMRMEQVIHAWTIDDYWALLAFYVNIVPVIVPAERCTVFIIEMGTEKICSIIGTGLQKMRIEPPKDKSIVGKVISTGAPTIASDLDNVYGYHTEVDRQTGFVTRNMVCAPIKSLTGHGVTGAVQVLNSTQGETFTADDLATVNEVAGHLSISIESILLNQEILRISSQVNREVERFETGYFRDTPFIAESPAMQDVLRQVRLVSATPVNVLIQGENGTGKELITRMIHAESRRRDQPFVAVNCASIPKTLVESEFFGYEKGAFTGATGSRGGYFEEASGGTLFLDEVADMPLSIQPKLLRAIQEGEGYRLGSKKLLTYDVRIISASNKSLKQEVDAGRFREDLFFRLFSVEISIPPLRERKDDIAPLAFVFLEDVCKRFEKNVAGFSSAVINLFEAYAWPGNVRQLRREIERLVVLTPAGATILPDACSPDIINSAHAARAGVQSPSLALTLPDQVRDLERQLIEKALAESGGNRSQAAQMLGITRQGLHKKLKRYTPDA